MRVVKHRAENELVYNFLSGGEHLRGHGRPVVGFLLGTALAVVLGLMFALSTSAFAMGGGGGGPAPAAPKIAKVKDLVADEVAEVEKPAVDPEGPIPAASESRSKKPEERSLATKGPNEDKTSNKFDERAVEITKPEPEAVKATVGFVEAATYIAGEGAGPQSLRIALSRSLPQPLTLSINRSGTASAGDITFSSNTVTFPQGETSAYVDFTVPADNVPELDEAIALTLGGELPDGVTFAVQRHTVIIPANDNTITFFAPSSASIAEEGGASTIAATINRPIPTGETATVTVTPSGSAVKDTDYRLLVSEGSLSGNTWMLPTQASDAILTVEAIGNSVDAEDKTLTLNFAGAESPSGWSIGARTHTITIIDDEVDEATVEFAKLTTQIKEGETGDLKVLLSRELSRPITVRLSREGVGLELTPSTVTFQPGRTEEVVKLTTFQDDDSNDEEATVSFGGNFPAGVTYGGIHGHIVTIIDDDPVVSATVGFHGAASSVVNEGGTANIQVRLSRSLPQPLTLSINRSGTASAGDITFSSNTVTFPQGETSAYVDFTVPADNVPELDEAIALTLGGELPDGVTFAVQRHTVIIPANDNTITFFAPSSASIAEEGGASTIAATINRPIPTGETATVTVTPSGSAVKDTDYRLLVSEGSLSGNTWMLPTQASDAILTVEAIGNSVDAEDKTLTLNFAGAESPSGWSIGARTHTVTIVDDDVTEIVIDTEEGPSPEFPKPEMVDATVGFVVPSSEVKEGASADIRVELSKSLPWPITLSVTASDTTINADGVFISDSLTFEPGEVIAFMDFSVQDDLVTELDETVTLTLGGNLPEGVVFDTQNHIVTIPASDQITDIEGDVVPYASIYFTESSTAYGDVTEGREDDLNIEVSIAPAISQSVTIDVTASGTAIEGEDYILSQKKLTISPNAASEKLGYTTANLRVTIIDDDIHEHDEWIFLAIGGDLPDGLLFTLNDHTIDIIDNDPYIPAEPGEITHIREINPGDGDISIVNRKTVDRNIEAELYGDSGIEIINYEYVGRSIEAAHHGNGDISIENQGNIGWSIEATHRGNGDISIENLRRVDWMIEAEHHGDGGILIKNATQGIVDKSIRATHRKSGNISIENRGSIDWRIKATHHGDSGIEIVNHGTVGVGIEATHRGNGDISIVNQGNVNWHIKAEHDGANDISIINHGHVGRGIEATNLGGNIRFSGNVGEFPNAFKGKSISLGNVTFGQYDDLEIIGDYDAPSGAQLNFHVGLDRWKNGELEIEGDVTGQSRVSLVLPDTISPLFPIESSPLIKVDGQVQVDDFVGEETIGAFRYVLEHDSIREYKRKAEEFQWVSIHQWRFVNRGLSDTAVKTSKTPDEIAKNIETPPANNLDKKPEELGLWGEQNGSHTTIGLDALAMRWMGGNMLVGTSMAQNSSTSNNIDVESQITALTASWERKGFYVGGQTRYASFTSDVSTDRLSVVQDNEGTGVSASADLGYRFALPFGGMDFEVAPQVQLTWSRVNFDDFVGPHGEKVSLEDGDLVTGRLGLSWDGEWQGAGGFGQVYGGMNLRSAVDGRTSVNVSGVSVANEQDDLSVNGKLGLSYEWDGGYAVHGEVSTLRVDDSEIRVDLGMRIDF